jgi:hypothetical protein
MRRKLFGVAVLFLGAAVSELRAGPCSAAGTTLQDLITLGVTGCTINGLTYSNFSWIPGGTNNTIVSPGQVNYSATDTTGVLDFTSSAFNISGLAVLNYTLQYVVDPPPIIIRFDQDLFDDPPTGLGTADIPTSICLGAQWVTNTCSTAMTSALLNFDHGGTTTQLHDSVTFAPQSIVGISTVIDLEAHGNTSEIGGFGNIANSPEPSSYLLTGLGLAILLWKRRRLVSISARRSD